MDAETAAASFALKGRSALITGGTTGIGRATAELFHALGARVAVTGRDPVTLEAAQRELPDGIRVLRADATSSEDHSTLRAQLERDFPRIDVLFLNAGIALLSPFTHVTDEHCDSQIDTNLKGTLRALRSLLPLVAPGGSVVLNTSIASVRGSAGLSIYSATKGALSALVRALAVELAPQGTRVNGVSPGPTNTPMQAKFGLPQEIGAAVAEQTVARIPLQRYGAPLDVAYAAAFLASGASSFITGIDLAVDGGFTAA